MRKGTQWILGHESTLAFGLRNGVGMIKTTEFWLIIFRLQMLELMMRIILWILGHEFKGQGKL